MAAAAVLNPVKKVQHLLPGADVLIPNWAQDCDAALDITIFLHLQRKNVAEASTNPGHALSHAYNRCAWEDCRQAEIAFFPIVFESVGGIHKVAETEVRRLASAMARISGQEEEEAS